MATLCTTLFRVGLRHPLRALQKQWSKHASVSSDQATPDRPGPGHGAQSPERLERIAAYARCGYFHMEFTAGMFVVPLEIPPE
ncbi:hypothetical protein [Paraburkholderia fynbosensis]|uniref:Uncharacterized protein n=1 Tax=Paraburkholderia fynbosensis TaxID=1200993 RepID=A0A6J5GUV1_9BURK|nr:hypothetical protein [Paraburkholderia fynbosensis]CAB3807315.1 hypothetical protein LMG27177_06308 [Paraburkholderia fynbosensis]